MESPDGKRSYLAKPVAAEAAQLLEGTFSINTQEFGEQTIRLTARLSACLAVGSLSC